MSAPESFETIKGRVGSHSDALVAYAEQMSSRYSPEKAIASGARQILEAKWIAYRTHGVTMGPLNVLLLFLGIFSFSTRENLVEYRTYHPIGAKGEDDERPKLFWGFFIEAAATVFGLFVLIGLIVGVMSWFVPGFEFIKPPIKALILVLGICGAIGYRALIRYAKAVRIPAAALKDQSSPFYLTAMKKIGAGDA